MMRCFSVLSVLLSLIPCTLAYPSYTECASDAKTEVKVGTVMMGVPITLSKGVTMSAVRNGAAITKHIPGELLDIQICGVASKAAVLVRSDDAANATLKSDDAPQNVCASQIVTKDSTTLPGSSMSLSFRPGCTNSTAPIKLQFVSCVWKGEAVELTELILEPETDASTGEVKVDPSCNGAPIPTPPPAASDYTTYTSLVWVHRWGVVLTWGFLFPLGVSLVRHQQSGSRMKLHRYIQTFGLLVEMIQLGCIIAAHQMGPKGNGPVQGDTHFGPDIGSAPTVTHKQRGLFIDICVVLQLVLGVCRVAPYPNSFKRRVWMWAHRVLGDGSMVVAWVNLWEAMPSLTDGNTFYSMVVSAALLMTGSVVVVPFRMMYQAGRAAEDVDTDSGPQEVVHLPTDAESTVPNFFGCGHCDQVFTARSILEIHHRFTHPGQECKEVLTPMPRRFADVMNTPTVTGGVPLSEVMKHKTKHDCWCVLNGKVYDLSNFIDSHPGGPNPILSFAGRDASKAWNLVHQPSWLNQYADRFEMLGPLAPEPPVGGCPETGSFGSFKRQFSPTHSSQASTALLD